MPRHDTPARGPYTEAQVDRLRHVAAYGPVTKRPGDDALLVARWLERDGEDGVDLPYDRARMLFDERGKVREFWLRRGGDI